MRITKRNMGIIFALVPITFTLAIIADDNWTFSWLGIWLSAACSVGAYLFGRTAPFATDD